jgi:hypothetical protein
VGVKGDGKRGGCRDTYSRYRKRREITAAAQNGKTQKLKQAIIFPNITAKN